MEFLNNNNIYEKEIFYLYFKSFFIININLFNIKLKYYLEILFNL
jgi:hypothetical protein